MPAQPYETMRHPLIPENHWLMPVSALSFLSGCLLWKYLNCGIWLVFALAFSIAGCVLLYLSGRKIEICLFLVFLLLGIGRTELLYSAPLPEQTSYEITAYVSGKVTDRNGERLTFALQGINLNGEPFSGKAYCSYYYTYQPEEKPELFDGALVSMTGKIYHSPEKDGEVHMDFSAWMAQNNYKIGITAYQLTVLNTIQDAPVMDWAYRFRCTLQNKLESTMGNNASILMALLFGDRSGLSADEYKAFQTLGIAHIMSVSGLHISMLSGMLLAVLKRLRVRRQFHVPLLIVLLGAYCAVSGFSAASVRASVMAVCASLTGIWTRRYEPVNSLCLAMVIVLTISPAQATSAGFVLSFSAMGGIMLLYPPLQRVMKRILQPKRKRAAKTMKNLKWNALQNFKIQFGSTLSLSLAAQLGVLMPTALYFHRLPTYGLFINLMIVPFVGSVLTPLYAITSLLCPLPGLSFLFGKCASVLSELLLWLVGKLSSMPYASIRVAAPCWGLILGIFAASICLFGRFGAKKGSAALAALLCVCIGIFTQVLNLPSEVRYIQTAAGQADAALLLDGKTTVVIDTGNDGQEILDYLEYEARDIDKLLITHLHSDHFGGVQTLLDNDIRIREVYLPAGARQQIIDEEMLQLLDRLERESGAIVHELSAGDIITLNHASLEVRWPDRETVRSGANANDYSLSVLLSIDGFRIYLSADVSDRYECYGAASCDVLKVAHHGSSSSTSDLFLECADPSLAIITCKSGSRSLPSEDTLNRLRKKGIAILRTDCNGDITLTVKDGKLIVSPYR